MKKCKDCYHYDVCGKKPPEDTPFSAEQYCPDNFKDKERIIEPPCKVGDTLYLVQIDFAGNYFMTAIVVSSKITMLSILRAYEEKTIIYMSTDKNQAEEELQALKEREQG